MTLPSAQAAKLTVHHSIGHFRAGNAVEFPLNLVILYPIFFLLKGSAPLASHGGATHL